MTLVREISDFEFNVKELYWDQIEISSSAD